MSGMGGINPFSQKRFVFKKWNTPFCLNPAQVRYPTQIGRLTSKLISYTNSKYVGEVLFEIINVFLIYKSRSSHHRCSTRKNVIENVTKSTWKHLCWSLFFKKSCRPSPFSKNTSGQLFPLKKVKQNCFWKSLLLICKETLEINTPVQKFLKK